MVRYNVTDAKLQLPVTYLCPGCSGGRIYAFTLENTKQVFCLAPYCDLFPSHLLRKDIANPQPLVQTEELRCIF